MIKTEISLPLNYSREGVVDSVLERLPVQKEEIKSVEILKRALVLSDKGSIGYKATVAVETSPEREGGLLKMRKTVFPYSHPSFVIPPSHLRSRPVVVGAGPAGLFSALVLALSGARPILVERGSRVEEREKRVKAFSSLGVLDPECNIQYGEGGAGTYSDGKLKVGSQDGYKRMILSEFVAAGAPRDIMYSTTAHVGTDKLSGVVKRIREKIIALGGEVRFDTKATKILTKDGKTTGIVLESDGRSETVDTEIVIVAMGHSARDSFEMLLSAGAILEPRPFGIGVRIEHPREYINELVYGKGYPPSLETASYHLVTHLPTGRSVYSFCMCPGGSVVAATNEAGGIVTNGMSEYLRDGDNSNAAFLVSVTPADFPSADPLSGLDLQRCIERKAYRLTDSYRAPVQRLGDLLLGRASSSFGSVRPTYPVGTEFFGAEEYLPDYITDSLRSSVKDFDAWMKGFNYYDAVLTGPETRTTSPVRVLRGSDFAAVGLSGLYPVGEGAGYSGGIISSARDGAMAAEAILLAAEKNN